MSYSQNDEEAVIVNHFAGRRGRFLDIGAHDGTYYSNTRALRELDWSGVLVEPDPRSLVKLLASEMDWTRTAVVSAAVCPRSTPLRRLWLDSAPDMEWASGITSFVPKAIRKARDSVLMVSTVTPLDLLDLGPYDFVNIDAEGTDFEILKAFGIALPFELLCIEPYFDQGRIDMKKYLERECGFQIIHETKDNLIAARKP